MYCVIAMVKLALIGCAVITMEDGILWPTDQSSKAIVDILLASKERKNALDCSINYAGGNVLIRGPVEARICSKDINILQSALCNLTTVMCSCQDFECHSDIIWLENESLRQHVAEFCNVENQGNNYYWQRCHTNINSWHHIPYKHTFDTVQGKRKKYVYFLHKRNRNPELRDYLICWADNSKTKRNFITGSVIEFKYGFNKWHRITFSYNIHPTSFLTQKTKE